MIKILKPVLAIMLQFAFVSSSYAGDFEWLDNLNTKAEADSSGYRLRLATRFHIGDTQVNTVIRSVDNLSDAYMVLRLGELSGRSTTQVMNEYHKNKNKGWGNMAKNLGIKPGSNEFHALKKSEEMQSGKGKNKNKNNKDSNGKSKDKNKGQNMGQNKGQNMGKGKGKH